MKNKTIYETHEDLVNHRISISDLIKEKLAIIKESKDVLESHAFLNVFEKEALELSKQLDSNLDDNKNNLLYGIPGTLKDNINFKDHITTGGSLSMENYVSVYDAKVVEELKKQHSIILAKTNLDEFGFGGTGTYSAYGIVKNPICKECITGGSSSGSAVAVKIGAGNYSIATDTGDSIRRPASFLGLVGYKPSRGVLSRYGVLPFCSTLDHVGMFTNDVSDVAILLDALAHFDERDFTSVELKTKDFFKDLKKLDKKPTLLVLDDVLTGLDKELLEHFNNLVSKLGKHYDIIHDNLGMDLLDIISPLYKAMAYSEGSTNWHNLTGITFGNPGFKDYNDYIDLIYQTRTKGFGKQIKSRMIIGNWMISTKNFDKIYLKSRKIRNVLIGRTQELLSKADALLLPGASTVAFKLDDVLNYRVSSNYCDDALQLANFAGLPSITIPFVNNKDNLPFGINLTAKKLEDKQLLQLAYHLEQIIKEEGFNHD